MWFGHAMDINLIAQQLLLEVPLEDKKAFLAALLFVRGLSSFQAAILLAERGMIQDARTITRSCFETVFCFGALHKDPGFLEKFEKHDIYGKRAFANALPVGELEPDAAEILSQFFDGLERSGEKGERLKWESVANSVGLGHVAGFPRSRPVSQRCETAPSFSSSQMSRYRAALGFYKRAFCRHCHSDALVSQN